MDDIERELYRGLQATALEMSTTRRKASADILAARRFYTTHICRCVLGKDKQELNHWYKEVVSCLVDALSIALKPRNKPVSKKELKESLLTFSLDSPEGFKQACLLVKYRYPDLANSEDFDFKVIYAKYKEFIESIFEYQKSLKTPKDTEVAPLSVLLDRFLEDCWNEEGRVKK